MPTLKLTDAVLRTLKADPEREVIYRDTELTGFGVRVMPSGVRSFIVQYRDPIGGRKAGQRRMTVKVAGGSVQDHRVEARKVLARAALGEDPSGARAEARSAPTFAELAERFMADEVLPTRARNTHATYRIHLDKHILPAFGHVQANAVTSRHVTDLRKRIAQPDGAGQITANRCIALIGAVYGWASKHEASLKTYASPTRNVATFKERRRERFLTSAEVERLGAALALAEGAGIPWTSDDPTPSKHLSKAENRRVRYGGHVTGAIRLLMLTGARLREILHLEWRHVDFERGVLLLPTSKSGPKTIAISSAAVEVLRELEKIAAGPFVIVGQSVDRPRSDLKKPWAAIAKHAGLSGVRLHDLRHSFASFGVAADLSLQAIGRLLGHSQTRTTERYAHLSVAAERRAADMIADRIADALKGKT